MQIVPLCLVPPTYHYGCFILSAFLMEIVQLFFIYVKIYFYHFTCLVTHFDMLKKTCKFVYIIWKHTLEALP